MFINTIKAQPFLAAAYKIQQQQKLDEKNLSIKLKLQALRALNPKPHKQKIQHIIKPYFSKNVDIN